MLSNYDLEDLAHGHKLQNFIVLSKDELDNMKLIKGNYILNMENEYDDLGNFNNGSHWISMFISDNNEPFYFDSFGCQAPNSILKYMRKTKKKISYSNRVIQNIRSSICGLYCLGFLCWMNNKPVNYNYIDWYEKFLDSFDDDCTKNDTILKSILRKY